MRDRIFGVGPTALPATDRWHCLDQRMAADIRLSGTDVALFGSDVHAGEHDPGLARTFVSALESQAHAALSETDAGLWIFLLGDLFEAWIGDDCENPCARSIGAALERLSRHGERVRCVLLRGNRDFLLGVPTRPPVVPFGRGARASIPGEPLVLNAFGTRTLVCHGDVLCTGDEPYLAFRRRVRDPAWQLAFLSRTLAQRREIAFDMREQSRARTRSMSTEIMDVTATAVDDALRASGASCIVHGHTHRPAIHRWELDGVERVRWVLPDWDVARRRGGFLRIDRRGAHPVGEWPPTSA